MKHILKHLGIILLLTILIIASVFIWMAYHTNHGESIEVPDLEDIPADQLAEVIKKNGLRFQIIDSVFSPDKESGVVFDQDPKAGSKVKENRRIYITLTSENIPKVRFPNIIYEKGINEEELSVRQATTILTQNRLEVGKITTRPDISTNVLEAKIKGKIVENGELVPRGSIVDLVVGERSDAKVYDIPNLIGLNIDEAKQALTEASLNLGSIIYLGKITDSINVIISKQEPDTTFVGELNLGEFIDVWVKEGEKPNEE